MARLVTPFSMAFQGLFTRYIGKKISFFKRVASQEVARLLCLAAGRIRKGHPSGA